MFQCIEMFTGDISHDSPKYLYITLKAYRAFFVTITDLAVELDALLFLLCCVCQDFSSVEKSRVFFPTQEGTVLLIIMYFLDLFLQKKIP